MNCFASAINTSVCLVYSIPATAFQLRFAMKYKKKRSAIQILILQTRTVIFVPRTAWSESNCFSPLATSSRSVTVIHCAIALRGILYARVSTTSVYDRLLINALVASQLSADAFAEHYTIGSAKHSHGKVLFAEVDINFRNPYFDIDHYLSLTVPHPDGKPKKTKFISSYGVLEHVDLKSLKQLYLVTPNGKALALSAKPYSAVSDPGKVRIYQEITPLTNLVASTLDERTFARHITSKQNQKGAPRSASRSMSLTSRIFFQRTKTVRSCFPRSRKQILGDYGDISRNSNAPLTRKPRPSVSIHPSWKPPID